MKEVHRKSQAAIGEYDEILTMVKVVLPRLEDYFFFGLAKMILQSSVNSQGKGRRVKNTISKCGQDELCQITRATKKRTRWRGIVENSSVMPRRK